ncbi:NUDIX domain-containing protein [Luteimonas sp. BDR2-5]|uniref:NUDIX domain-containing protein n=1 Tax=Proluteimonas luteida TaxID=2878685 RepID=UPI001E576A5D|nr:NUDIX domain-containing protein [Luteimonas sp. BDR2-5]MCD9026994.1 NUDIX domain-containing protein [Luteimonas sp. BDR2-5]
MLPITNERGESLVAIHTGSAGLPPDLPATSFALVLARHDGDVLLVRNRSRGVWELPGGWIDPGESAERCARRELAEESGQTPGRLRLAAWLVLDRPDGDGPARIFGALFLAQITDIAGFAPTSEIARLLWTPAAQLPTGISAIDAALIARFAEMKPA